MWRAVSAAVIVLAGLASACGGKTSTTPTSPSPASGGTSQPNLVGQWFGAGTVAFRELERGTSQQFSCEFSLGVTSQSSEEFSGNSSVNGSGSNSDPYCTQNGTFAGRVAGDGTVSNLRLQPPLGARACTLTSAAGAFSGNASSTSITAQMSDRWTCVDPAGRSYAADRTVTITLQRR